jgi:hypothetical protein
VTTPDPGTFLPVKFYQWQRLRIVHDDEVVAEEIPDAIFVDHLFENFLFDSGQIDLAALQRVVHLLVMEKKSGVP